MLTNTAHLVTKDVKTQEQIDLEAAAIGDQPMDPRQAIKLAAALQAIGIDTTAFKEAIASGQQADQVDAMIAMLNPFLWPDAAPAQAPARPAKLTPADHRNLKPRPAPVQAAKAKENPYANLTRGWFKPGPGTA